MFSNGSNGSKIMSLHSTSRRTKYASFLYECDATTEKKEINAIWLVENDFLKRDTEDILEYLFIDMKGEAGKVYRPKLPCYNLSRHRSSIYF